MKFEHILRKHTSLEAIGIPFEPNLSIFQNTQKDIQYACESVEIAQRDYETLNRLSKMVSNGKMTGVSLETACIGLNVINKRYGLPSVATEGIGDGIKNAISSVLKFLSQSMRFVTDKFKSMLGKSSEIQQVALDNTEENIKKLDTIRNDKELIDELEEQYSKERNNLDEDYKTYKEKGIIEFKIKGKYKPSPYDANGLSTIVASLDKTSTIVADSVRSIISLSEQFIEQVDKLANAGDATDEVLNDITSRYMEDFTSLLVKSDMKETRGEDGSSVFTSALSLSHNVAISVTKGASYKDHKLKVDLIDAEIKDGESISLNEEQFNRIFKVIFSNGVGKNLASVSTDTAKLSTKAESLHSRLKGLDSEKADSIKALTGFISGVINKATQGSIQMAAGIKAIDTSIAVGCMHYSSTIVKYNSSVVTTGTSTESSYAVDGLRDFMSLENVDFEVGEILALEQEAISDFNTAMESFLDNKRYISSGNINMSLEGYMEHLKNKYSSFNISLEDEDKQESAKEDNAEDKKPETSKASGGSGGIIGFFKAIFDFIARVIKTIYEKIMNLIRGDRSRSDKSKEKMDKVASQQKEMKKEGIPKEKKKKVKENKASYSPEVVEYFEKGRFVVMFENPQFSLGKKATFKDIETALNSYTDSLVRIPKLILNIGIIPATIGRAFLEAQKAGQLMDNQSLEDFKIKASLNLIKIISEDSVKPEWPEKGTLTISNFCNSYMIVKGDEFVQGATSIFTPVVVQPDDFDKDTDLELSAGDLSKLSEIMVSIYKESDEVKEAGEKAAKKATADNAVFHDAVSSYLKDMENKGLRDTEDYTAVKNFFNFYKNYLVGIVNTIGKLNQRVINMRMFLEKVISIAHAKETRLRDAKPETEDSK